MKKEQTLGQKMGYTNYPIEIISGGNLMYFEEEGYWEKYRYDKDGENTYYEDSDGDVRYAEFEDGEMVFLRFNGSVIFDDREPKEEATVKVNYEVKEFEGMEFKIDGVNYKITAT